MPKLVVIAVIGAAMVVTAVVGFIVQAIQASQSDPGLCDFFPWLPGC